MTILLRNLSIRSLLAAAGGHDNQDMQRTPAGQLIYDALQFHAQWRVRIKQAIRDGAAGDTPEHLAAHADCPLGRWLAHGIDPARKSDAEYAIVKDAHHRFHEVLSDIALSIERGDSSAACEKIAAGSPFAELTSTMNRELTRWLAKIEIVGQRSQSA